MPMKIPTIEELTDPQLEIQDLPISGRYLITGGPGSGKTTIAIRRTEFIKKDSPNSSVQTFLFTNTLNDFFGDGVRSLRVNSNVTVWAKWQVGFLRSHEDWEFNTGDRVPKSVWPTLSRRILDNHPLEETLYDHLIIDEAQDYSVSDLSVMNQIADNVTVFADENQRLRDRGIEDVDEIKEVLSIDEEDCYDLKENHRNTKEIMASAVSLAPEEIDIDPDNIMKSGQKPRIISNQNSDKEIEYISRVIKNNRQKDIGILHLENAVIESLYDELSNYNDNEINYEIMRRQRFNFSIPSPKLCTLDSAKGLEFDIVLMPRMNQDYYYEHPKNLKRIYVGMTRAREDLLISYSGGYPTVYLSQIDPETVKRVQNQ